MEKKEKEKHKTLLVSFRTEAAIAEIETITPTRCHDIK